MSAKVYVFSPIGMHPTHLVLAGMVVAFAAIGMASRVATQQLPSCGESWEIRTHPLILRDWPDRPPELGTEPLVDRLRAEVRCHEWVIFMAGYPGRLPDWLAFNATSGEVRRYVDVKRRIVEDDLLGIRRAPSSAQDLTRWGKPESREPVRRFSVARYLEDPPDFFAQLAAGSLRVYALPVANPPFGLHYESSQASGQPLESVSMDYKNDDRSVTLSLATSDWLYGRDIVASPDSRSGVPYTSLYDKLRGDLVADEQGGAILPRTLELDGLELQGAVFESAEQPDQRRFTFRTPELTVHGAADGLTVDEVIGVLAKLVAINDHPEVVSDMRSRHQALLGSARTAPEPAYQASDQPTSAFTRLTAIQPVLAALYPTAVLTRLVGRGDLLAQDGSARLWTVAIWKPLSDQDMAELTARSSRPGGAMQGGMTRVSGDFISFRSFTDSTDPRWVGAVANIEETDKKDRPGLAPLAQAGKLGVLDSTEAVTLGDAAGGGAFRQQTAGTLTRIALGLQSEEPPSYGILPPGIVSAPTGPMQPVWGLRYDAADRLSKFVVILDAQTGATLFIGS